MNLPHSNALAIASLVFAALACASEPELPTPPSSVRSVLGTSIEGRPIDAFRFGPDVAGGVLILATIHGSEPAGAALLQELARALEARPELWADAPVVLVPVANPDGRAHDIRANARGIDLNRNFPAPNFDGSNSHGDLPLSEPETRALHGWITAHHPRIVISIHQPLTCIDWDGPADALAQRAAAACALPLQKLGGRPGSLGSWAGNTLGIAVITIELRGGDELLTTGALFQRYGGALFALLEPEPVDG